MPAFKRIIQIGLFLAASTLTQDASSLDSASSLAPALGYQCTALGNLTSNFQTTAADLIQIDQDIDLVDQTKAVLNAYTTPCSQIITQTNALVTLLTATAAKSPTDPSIATDNTTFQSLLTGLNTCLNTVIPSSNLILLQTQTITFSKVVMPITYPHFDVEWSSIHPMSFTTNTQAGTLASTITSLPVSMNATNNSIALYISNLNSTRAILVALYNSSIDQYSQYFQAVANLAPLIPLTKK